MIFHQPILIAVIVCGTVAVSAINKKSDDNGPSSQASQPIYSGPGSGGGPYSVPNQYNPNNGPDQGAQNNMPQGSPQNNLYYYYYPVQDKPKEASYHNANPQMGHQPSASHDGQDHGPMEAAASGSEMSYSSQDLGQEYNPQNQGFDPQTLSNLASQLQMGFNGAQNYESNNGAMPNFGQGEASNQIAHVHTGYNGPMGGPQGPMAFAPQGPYGAQGGYFGNNNQQIQPQSSEITSSITSGLRKYGLTSILMPVLALAGLSLLLPTVTSLGTTTTKTKRSIDDSQLSSYIEKADNYYKLYNKAMEKEECMNRMLCELGDAVSGVRGRSALLMVAENLAPQWMEKKMAVFKNGALSKDTTKCKKYSC